MFKRALLTLALLFVVSTAVADEWYDGGTLHRASAAEWRQASSSDHLATAADFVAAAYNNDQLKPQISSRIQGVDDIRPLAEELVNALDSAYRLEPGETDSMAGMDVATSAAMLMMMMGWTGS